MDIRYHVQCRREKPGQHWGHNVQPSDTAAVCVCVHLLSERTDSQKAQSVSVLILWKMSIKHSFKYWVSICIDPLTTLLSSSGSEREHVEESCGWCDPIERKSFVLFTLCGFSVCIIFTLLFSNLFSLFVFVTMSHTLSHSSAVSITFLLIPIPLSAYTSVTIPALRLTIAAWMKHKVRTAKKTHTCTQS